RPDGPRAVLLRELVGPQEASAGQRAVRVAEPGEVHQVIGRVRTLAARGDAEDLQLRGADLVRVLVVDGLDEEAEGPPVVGGPVHEEVTLMVADDVALERALVIALGAHVAFELYRK